MLDQKEKVFVHLAEGFEEVEAVTVADLLRRAGVDVMFISVTGERLVKGAHGIEVKADLLYEEADYQSCEMLVLPGGMPGTLHLQGHGGLAEKLSEFAAQGKWLAAICAAPMVLGELGLLSGKRATIYPGMEEHLKGAEPRGEAVVLDGRIVTSKGPGTAMEFGLKLIEVLKGSEAAATVRAGLLL